MITRFFSILWVILVVVLFASCSATKSANSSHSIEGMTELEFVENVIENTNGWKALTAKMSLSVDLEGKDVTKVSGTLRIKRDEIIQISIAPFLGIEVARVEISPMGILAIDRMNKRYVEMPFSDVEVLSKTSLDFHTLQALFFNELFLPGKGNLTVNDASLFNVEQDMKGTWLDVKRTKRLGYHFLIGSPDTFLKESYIGLKGTSYGLRWKYDDFRMLGEKRFPVNMKLIFEGGKKPVKAFFALSRLSMNEDWESHTEVSKKYKKVALEEILKILLKK